MHSEFSVSDFVVWSRRLSAVAVASGFFTAVLAAQSQAPVPPVVKETVTVEVSPIAGSSVPTDQVAAPVQTAGADDIARSGALNTSGFLNHRLTSISVNETQGNPFQPDLNFRGYTASPLLGTPQGLSLYMDGVRLNQPFGQVVSWDLIPRLAIRSLTLMPGSNPVFGLNTLGGALALETKDGRNNPGTMIEAGYGSDARRRLEFEHGGSRGSVLHWYLSGDLFKEDGWRTDSPSDVRQVFGKLGWHFDRSDVAVSVSHADNALTGNGLQTTQFLETDRASVYTKPDETHNRSSLLNVTASRRVSDSLLVSGNAFYRHIRTRTLNGDINDDSLDQSVYQPGAAERAALLAAGYGVIQSSGLNADNTPFPFLRCVGNVLIKDEPGEKCNGLLNRSLTAQHSGGANAQAVWNTTSGTRTNQLTVGAAFEGSHSAFSQSSELGYLNPDRSITGLNVLADGVNAGDVDGVPYDARVDLDGSLTTGSAYVANTFSPNAQVHITASGRVDRSSLTNRDNITPGGAAGSLDGHHVFQRFNPAMGLTFSPTTRTNVYAGYTEGSRAPSSIELGCADPEQPCKLPNAMAGDPPLDQVVTRTMEVGVRGVPGRSVNWNAGFFRAENRDDILFVASEQTGFGYFKNFGNTRRMGVELGANVEMKRLTVGAGYTFLDATFQSEEVVDGTGNSSNEEAEAGRLGLEGTIEIEPGDRMPLLPRHIVKAFADLTLTSRLSVGVDVIGASGAIARGNENNEHEPDGVIYRGEGSTSPYSVTDLNVRFRVTSRVEIVAEIRNVFDAEYSTGSQLGPTGFTDAGNFIARPLPAISGEFPLRQTAFEAPGAPRTAWIAVRITPFR